MSPINVKVLISLIKTFVPALVGIYKIPRLILGWIFLTLCFICEMISRIISAKNNEIIRAKLLGFENTGNQELLYNLFTFKILLIVKITLSVSPENRFDLLAPSPFEILSSSSLTFTGPEHCIIWLSFAFSIHLKAVMSSLFPCKIPAWLAPVCEDRSVSHSFRTWLLFSIMPFTVGIKSLSRASHNTSYASPSISIIITPGYGLTSFFLFFLASL